MIRRHPMIFLNQLQARRREESGAALIFAVIVMMVMALTITLVTVAAASSITSTTDQTIQQLKREAAETAIQSAGFAANADTTATTQSIFERARTSYFNGDLRNISNQGSEPDVDIRWRWRAEPVVEYGGRLSWYVIAQGYIAGQNPDTQGQTIRALYRGMKVTSGGKTGSATGITYNLAPENPWQSAPVYGENKVTFSTNVKVRSYDSYNGTNPQLLEDTRARVGTNGAYNIITGGTIPTTGVLDYGTAGTPTCTGSTVACNAVRINSRGYAVDNTELTNALGAACPSFTYPAWKASENGGVLNLTGTTPACFSSMVFDQNTTVLGSNKHVYVTGNTTVNSGVKVNVSKGAYDLRIMSDFGQLNVGNTNASLDSTTQANFYFATNSATCNIAGTFQGALSCNEILFRSNSVMYADASASVRWLSRTSSGEMNLWFEAISERV